MMTIIRNLFSKPQKSEFKLSTFKIVPHKKNWEYEVTSQFIFDPRSGAEYLTIRHALANGAMIENLIINEDDIQEGIVKAVRYERNDTDPINKLAAARCDLGILTVLKGEHAGQEFFYQQVPEGCDMGVKTVVYGYLAHNFVSKRVLKSLKKNDYLLEELFLYFGEEIYEGVLGD